MIYSIPFCWPCWCSCSGSGRVTWSFVIPPCWSWSQSTCSSCLWCSFNRLFRKSIVMTPPQMSCSSIAWTTEALISSVWCIIIDIIWVTFRRISLNFCEWSICGGIPVAWGMLSVLSSVTNFCKRWRRPGYCNSGIAENDWLGCLSITGRFEVELLMPALHQIKWNHETFEYLKMSIFSHLIFASQG